MIAAPGRKLVRPAVHSGCPFRAAYADTVVPSPTAATPDPRAAYAWPCSGEVPVIPFWTTHEPGSDRIQRTVPMTWQRWFGHCAEDPWRPGRRA